MPDRDFSSIRPGSYWHTIHRFSLTGLTDRGVAIKETSSSEFEQVLNAVAHAALADEPGAAGNTLFSHFGFLCGQKKDRPNGRSLKVGEDEKQHGIKLHDLHGEILSALWLCLETFVANMWFGS